MPADIEELYYLAYEDMIEEQKREEEKKEKEKQKKRERERESKIMELLKKRGVRLPAKVQEAQARRAQMAQQDRENEDLGPSLSIPGLDMNALMDELDE